MPPSVDLTAAATPADFSLPSPLPVHFLPGVAVHAMGAAAPRYLVKFSVVPDSSERKNTLIGSAGSVTPELMAAIALSSQLVILPLKAMAMGPGTVGRFHAGEPQCLAASSASTLPSFGVVLSAESEPAKSTW